MVDDVLINKADSLERCLQRAESEYYGHQSELPTDFTRQDALVLNLLRACETAIDMAMHLVRVRRLGVPQTTREAFDLLAEGRVIDDELATALKRMIGFRNIAVHNYQQIDWHIVGVIVEQRLADFRTFAKVLLQLNLD